jgi:YVTN family beta-propeller protein
MAPSPDGTRLVLLLNGYREQGIQVVDRATGKTTQLLKQPAAFIGLTFSPDGQKLYASGGNQDAVYVYAWSNGSASLTDSVMLAQKKPRADGTRYPSGIGVSPDGARLYVAENLADSIAVIDLATLRVIQRLAAGRYPYAVAVSGDGTVYVSSWGESSVSVFSASSAGLTARGRINTARHPSALLLNNDGSRLYAASASTDAVSVIDTHARRLVGTITAHVPGGVREGSTPNALALSPDGSRLYIAEADNNAVSVANLENNTVFGRIPAGWYPTALLVTKDSLFVVNGKGNGTGPNPRGPWSGSNAARQYTLSQTSGTLMSMELPRAQAEMVEYSARVARANAWDARAKSAYPPIEHVIYVIKENRTYDQMLGDLSQADGDTSLVFFPRAVTPNHHALAERFGVFDRFFVNAEVSADGHNWSVGAYVTDYTEKTLPSNYSDRGRTYDYEGTNRDVIPDEDAAEPAEGYLWNLAERSGITFRNYGEFVADVKVGGVTKYKGTKPYLAAHTDEDYPGYDLDIRDQHRVDIWLTELAGFDREGKMPALQILRLPNDHTSGASAGKPTPRAHVADNDLALGRVIEALSKSSFWKSTAVFVLEDDAQNGSDHVDSHRSPLIVISPWTKGGVIHRFANTTDVIATIEELLGLGTLSQFDHYGRPLRDIWAATANVTPYKALVPSVSLDEVNPRRGSLAQESRMLALSKEDIADEDLFNRILWRQIKGDKRPWPGVKRMPSLELATPR